ncbi:DUF6179 domain-containing protein [Lachnospiraceae bacterium 54-53]
MNIKAEELVQVVAELADKYTGRDSSSITYEKAGQLMEAVLYCIREYEAHLADGQEQLSTEAGPDGKTAYGLGYELVLKKVKEARDLYNRIIPDFRFYDNRCCYDTFARGIPSFFVRYDPRFAPQNHILTLDYPVLMPVNALCGIDAVNAYIRYAALEQLFLVKLPDAYVRHVLRAYSTDYEELFINLPAIVLRNLLGCRIAGRPADTRSYTRQEVQRLKDFVNGNTAESLEQSLKELIGEVTDFGYGGNGELGDYLKADAHDFSFELKHAAANRCMDSVLAL